MVRMMVRRVYICDFGRSGSTFEIKIDGAYDGAAYIYIYIYVISGPSDPFLNLQRALAFQERLPRLRDGPPMVRGGCVEPPLGFRFLGGLRRDT